MNETFDWETDDSWTFEAEARPTEFLDALDALDAVVDDCRLTLGPGGIEATGMDPAHVAVTDVAKDCFETVNGKVTVGVNVHELVENAPPFYPGSDTFSVRVSRFPDGDDTFIVHNGREGGHTATAFDPSAEHLDATFPDPDSTPAHRFEIATPKLRGVFGALCDAADDKIRVTPRDGEVLVEALEDKEAVHEWAIDADVTAGRAQLFSTDYLADAIDAFWTRGTTTVAFGPNNPLRLSTDGLRYAQARRVYDDDDWAGDHE